MSNFDCQVKKVGKVENYVDKVHVLVDKSSTGRVRPWAIHKAAAVKIAQAYASVDYSKAERMFQCADYLSFVRRDGGGLVLHDARFCRVRLCPICQWRRALKTYAQMSKVLDFASAEGYQFVMLTLTVRNCQSDELSETLDRLMLAFNRLTKYKVVRQAVKGWYRGCEVTHNTDVHSPYYDTYHPHLHVILAVRNSYFKGRYYIKRDTWRDLWQRALQVDYDVTQVDVRKCYGGSKAVAEAVKYTVKSGDIINEDDWQITVDTLATLDNALNKRRFIGLGGVLKDIHKQLNLADIEDDSDLVHTDDDSSSDDEVTQDELVFWWSGYNQRYER